MKYLEHGTDEHVNLTPLALSMSLPYWKRFIAKQIVKHRYNICTYLFELNINSSNIRIPILENMWMFIDNNFESAPNVY